MYEVTLEKVESGSLGPHGPGSQLGLCSKNSGKSLLALTVGFCGLPWGPCVPRPASF